MRRLWSRRPYSDDPDEARRYAGVGARRKRESSRPPPRRSLPACRLRVPHAHTADRSSAPPHAADTTWPEATCSPTASSASGEMHMRVKKHRIAARPSLPASASLVIVWVAPGLSIEILLSMASSPRMEGTPALRSGRRGAPGDAAGTAGGGVSGGGRIKA